MILSVIGQMIRRHPWLLLQLLALGLRSGGKIGVVELRHALRRRQARILSVPHIKPTE